MSPDQRAAVVARYYLGLNQAEMTRAGVRPEHFLPLRMEVRDSRGVIVDRSEVTSVEYDVSIPAATFAYVPPAGVAVATFTGGDGSDVKRALACETQSRTQPIKSP